jgi:hypothetical protein
MMHIISFNVFLGMCLIYSWRCGGAPEKVAMLAQVAAAALTIIAIHFLPHSANFAGLAKALVMIDVALLISLMWLALRANRLWTIVLAGLQLSTVVVHLSKAVFPALPAASYGIFAQFWAWPMLITTALGTHYHRMRIREHGEERDWKPLWPHSVRANCTA